MKTLNFVKTTALILGLTLTLASCSKDDLRLSDGMSSADGSEAAELPVLGQILDEGIVTNGVKGESRQMKATFYDQGLLVSGTNGAILASGLEIHISFYTYLDDVIPTGLCLFSPDAEKTFLSFDQGYVLQLTESGLLNNYLINGGSVDVSFNGSFYEFTFNCTLDNGDLLTGTIKGNMSYSDAWVY